MMLSVDRSQHSAAGHQRDRTNSKVAEGTATIYRTERVSVSSPSLSRVN